MVEKKERKKRRTLKQKQKQSQKITVNINSNNKTPKRINRGTTTQSRFSPITVLPNISFPQMIHPNNNTTIEMMLKDLQNEVSNLKIKHPQSIQIIDKEALDVSNILSTYNKPSNEITPEKSITEVNPLYDELTPLPLLSPINEFANLKQEEEASTSSPSKSIIKKTPPITPTPEQIRISNETNEIIKSNPDDQVAVSFSKWMTDWESKIKTTYYYNQLKNFNKKFNN
jgi:hypothetical protein